MMEVERGKTMEGREGELELISRERELARKTEANQGKRLSYLFLFMRKRILDS